MLVAVCVFFSWLAICHTHSVLRVGHLAASLRPLPPEDFTIDVRCDPQANWLNDICVGWNPCTIVVTAGKVCLKDMRELQQLHKVPQGRYMDSNMTEILSLDDFRFLEFFVALHNQASQQHHPLTERVFGQVVG